MSIYLNTRRYQNLKVSTKKVFKLDLLFYSMIKRLKIKNFKSYRDSELEFGKVNVVVGIVVPVKPTLLTLLVFLNIL